MLDHGLRWDYPAIDGAKADLLLVTHEHLDHDGVEIVGGDPGRRVIRLRSTGSGSCLSSPAGRPRGSQFTGRLAVQTGTSCSPGVVVRGRPLVVGRLT